MAQFIVNITLDGFESKEEREAAELKFIEEQLDCGGASVKILKIDEEENDETIPSR